MAAELDTQPGNFGQASGNECCSRVIAKPHAIGNACCDRDHILYCAARFDADDIGAGIDPSPGSMKFSRHASGKSFIVRRECQGCRESLCHFLCKTWTRQYTPRRGCPELFLCNLMRQLCRFSLESLAPPDYWHGFSASNDSPQGFTQSRNRHNNQSKIGRFNGSKE